jgi:hypothetical protein
VAISQHQRRTAATPQWPCGPRARSQGKPLAPPGHPNSNALFEAEVQFFYFSGRSGSSLVSADETHPAAVWRSEECDFLSRAFKPTVAVRLAT